MEASMRIILDPEAYDEFIRMLEQKPRDMPRLRKLLEMDSPFASEEPDVRSDV